jgi:hypothetical protein
MEFNDYYQAKQSSPSHAEMVMRPIAGDIGVRTDGAWARPSSTSETVCRAMSTSLDG